ncbi:MAG: transcription antitermination protein NusB [Asticcacaulis sp.]|nr:transcription antitermination protein NusB [Asticcacaulis sp.]
MAPPAGRAAGARPRTGPRHRRRPLRRLGQTEDALDGWSRGHASQGAPHAILVISAAQLLFLDVPDHAAVSLAVDLAHADRHTEHYATFVNGVMRAARGRAETAT